MPSQPALATVVRPSDADFSASIRILFADVAVSDVELAQIAARLWRCKLEAGEVLLGHGEPAQACYIISEGLGRLEFRDPQGQVTAISAVRPGELVGEAALAGLDSYAGDVLAGSDLTALVMNRKDYLTLEQQMPAAALHLMGAASAQTSRRERAWTTKITGAAQVALGVEVHAEPTAEPDEPGPSVLGRLFARISGNKEEP